MNRIETKTMRNKRDWYNLVCSEVEKCPNGIWVSIMQTKHSEKRKERNPCLQIVKLMVKGGPLREMGPGDEKGE